MASNVFAMTKAAAAKRASNILLIPKTIVKLFKIRDLVRLDVIRGPQGRIPSGANCMTPTSYIKGLFN